MIITMAGALALHCPCGRRDAEPAFSYDAPPAGETKFDFGSAPYRRRYLRCRSCGHWYADTDMDMSALYSGNYLDSTYGARMRQAFERIIALPPEKSDNAGRVAQVLEFARTALKGTLSPTLLDIGSGLGVFPYKMKEAGWRCTALDPDPRASAHAREVVGVEAITGDFMKLPDSAIATYNVVTLNKVLEHVVNPVAMLRKAARHVKPHGFVYIEVPDIAAAADGPEREEFFIEHLHVFSPESVRLVAQQSGLVSREINRIREPSGKYTLTALLVEGDRARIPVTNQELP